MLVFVVTGHDILMATMLNGAAVMDAAMLLIAGSFVKNCVVGGLRWVAESVLIMQETKLARSPRHQSTWPQ
jgi:hypothetical protein